MKLTATQEAHLSVFEAAYQVYAETRRTVEARVREQVAAELQAAQLDASKTGNRAVAAGVPISRLGEKGRAGMNTRNFNTIREFLNLTAGHADTGAEAVAAFEKANTPARFTLSLDPRYTADAQAFAAWSAENSHPDYPKGPELVTISFTPEEHASFWEDKKRHIRGGGKTPPQDTVSTRRLDRGNRILWADEKPTAGRDTTNERVYDSTITAWLNFYGGNEEVFAWLDAEHPDAPAA